MARLLLVLTTAAALLFAFVTPAAAAEPPAPIEDVSAIDQYRESIPTAAGARATGEPGSKKKGSLSQTAQAQIDRQGGDDAELLLKVVTAPEYGAPDAPAPRPAKGTPDRATLAPVAGTTSGNSGYIAFLGIVVITVALAGAAFAVARRRRT